MRFKRVFCMKKRIFPRAVCSALAFTVCASLCVIMLFGLSGCSSNTVKALSLGKTYFTEKTYAYYMACYKQYWITVFGESDSDEFWSSEYNGVNVTEYLQGVSETAIKTKFAAVYLFDQYNLKLSDSGYKSIDNNISGVLSALGGEASLDDDAVMSSLGITVDDLREVFIIDEKVSAVQDFLFGDSGEMPLTDEDRENFYQNRYFRFKHFYLMNYDYDLDSDGKIQYDDNGYAKVKEITDERYEEKLALAKDVLARAEGGEDFDPLISEYSEELSKDKYPLGHYLTVPNDYFTDISNAVTSADIGDFVLFESSLGVHIIERIELDEGAWGKEENEYGGDFDNFDDLVTEQKFKTVTAEYVSQIEVNEEITKKYKINEMPYSSVWYYMF